MWNSSFSSSEERFDIYDCIVYWTLCLLSKFLGFFLLISTRSEWHRVLSTTGDRGCRYNWTPKNGELLADAVKICIVVRAAIVAVAFASVALTWFCIYRVAAVQYVLNSNSLETLDQRTELIEKAIAIDPENGAIQAYYGNLLLNNGKASDAIPHLREAIRVGQATSIDYSYLATAQILTNDRAGAEETISEALKAYPYSVFLRTRRAVILKDLGRQDESNAEFSRALAINDGQARSWWNFIDKGGAVAAQLAFDEKLPPLAELLPGNAVYAIKTERELRFPDEKFKLPMPSE